MGKYVFRLPDIGEGIAEAEIVAWHVKVGDLVEEDGRLADMMTDKATVEMESPVSGKIVQVAGDVGDVIAIGSPLVVIETEGGELPGHLGHDCDAVLASHGLFKHADRDWHPNFPWSVAGRAAAR